jgi:hypothetical protein
MGEDLLNVVFEHISNLIDTEQYHQNFISAL